LYKSYCHTIAAATNPVEISNAYEAYSYRIHRQIVNIYS